jgi:hypothetical protein
MKMKMRNFPGPRRFRVQHIQQRGVVEISLQVGDCWLWSLIIFLIQRSFFQPCLYPMKYLHPRSMYTLPRGGVQRGGTPSAGSGGAIPLAGGSGGKRAPRWGFRGEAPEGKIAL